MKIETLLLLERSETQHISYDVSPLSSGSKLHTVGLTRARTLV